MDYEKTAKKILRFVSMYDMPNEDKVEYIETHLKVAYYEGIKEGREIEFLSGFPPDPQKPLEDHVGEHGADDWRKKKED